MCFVLWTSSFLITHVHLYMHVYFHTQTFFLMRTHRAASRLHLPRKSRARRDPRPPSVTRLRCNTYCFCLFLSVWAKGSSNSGGLLYIFTASHLHFHIYTDHLHIFTSSHLHIFTHLLSLSFSLLHIFSSSHLHIFSLPPSISLSRSLSLSLSLALPCPLPLSLSPSPSLSLSPSCPLSQSLSFFFFSLLRPRAVPTRRHEMATFWHEMRFDRQKLRSKIAILHPPRQPFCTKWGSNVKNWGKIATLALPRQPFCAKWGSIVKNCEVKLRFYILRGNSFARNEVRASKTTVKLRFWSVRGNLFVGNEVRAWKTDGFWWCSGGVSVCKSVCV